MQKWQALVMLFVVPAAGPLAGRAAAQDPAGDVLYSNYRHFRIPFQAGPNEQRLKQLQLFVSTDQGRTWQANAVAPPEQKFFRFICDRDGTYWFTVQTLDRDGRYFPASLDGAQPSLKVVVDTQPPVVQLRPLAGRGTGEVGVTWDIRDEHLDLRQPDTMRLEYRPAGGVAWMALPADPLASQHYWSPQTNAPLEVRLKVRDRAGNVGEATTNVIVGQQDGGQPFASAGSNGGLPLGFTADTERRLVNSKKISLNYELKDVGPSGVSVVELWFTQDGRSWNRYPLAKTEDGAGPPRPLVFEVNGEGIYGFTLVAKSGVGLSERPPQIGDRPQIWVEVDLTRPVVQLHQVLVGRGADKGKLTIRWTARDKNLGREPITLSYAEKSGGPWTPIAEKIANTGRYVWAMPEQVPYQFYVRVEATDRAGNVGAAVTPDLVRVDLAQPKVHILNVEPAGR
jgi:hypothetical protein